MSFGVSIIIPAYNSAAWLEPTVGKLDIALIEAGIKRAEVVIVNDGSSDDTSIVAHKLKASVKVRVIDQKNSGRYLARKAGVMASSFDSILFIDSRVFLDKNALKFLTTQFKEHPEREVWNSHVNVKKEGNIIARFGDAITFIGWRRYFSDPRLTSYGLKEFDYFPKGTTCFFVPKKIILEATKRFEKETFDIRNSSDDTHLIRLIAERHRINISPDFACTYHARTNLLQFVRHTMFRGQSFVAGFLSPGNRFFLPLTAFLIGSAAVLISVILNSSILLPVTVVLVILWVLELLTAIALGVAFKDALSLFLLSPIFAIIYALGIWKATIIKLITSVKAKVK